jgi:hypothetical protein
MWVPRFSKPVAAVLVSMVVAMGAVLAQPSSAQEPTAHLSAPRAACPAGQLLPGPVTRVSPGGLSAAAGSFVSWPDVIVDDTGRLTTAFQVQKRSQDDADLWSADVPASSGDPRLIRAGDPGFPRMGDPHQIRNLGSDAVGTQTMAWVEFDSSSFFSNVMVATRPPGGAWSAPTIVNQRRGDIDDAHLAVSAGGAAVLTWSRLRGEHRHRVIAAYRPAGSATWQPPRLLVRNAASSEVGIDDAGNATIAYDAHRGYVRLRHFEPAVGKWLAHETHGADAAGSIAGASDLAVSPNGAVTMTWEQKPRNSPRYAHFAVRWHPDSSQTLPMVRRRGGNRVVDNALGIDENGVAVAAWWTANHDVVAQTSRPDGSWRHRVVLAKTQRGPELSTLNVTMNRRGDTLVVWKAKRGDDPRLRGRYRPAGGVWGPVQRLTPSGVHANIWTTAIGTDGTAAVAWMRTRRVAARQLTVC